MLAIPRSPPVYRENILRISSNVLALAFLFLTVLAQPRPASADPEEPSLRHMIGQMLMVGFVGSSEEADGYRTVLQQAFEGKIGGVLYLGRNIRSLDSTRRMNEGLQSVSGTRLLIAIDQEGGHIERLWRKISSTLDRTAKFTFCGTMPVALVKLEPNTAVATPTSAPP